MNVLSMIQKYYNTVCFWNWLETWKVLIIFSNNYYLFDYLRLVLLNMKYTEVYFKKQRYFIEISS